jgi:hypothetical protein
MSDYQACAELCDEYGFPRQAALLRAVEQGGLRVFAVCARLSHDDGFLDRGGGALMALFLNREDAERDARHRNLLVLRERNLYEYCEGEIAYMTGLTSDQFEREVTAILGTEYKLPDPDTHQGSLFPADATDEQIRAVSRLFEANFFYVAELEFVDGANPSAPAESAP